MNFFTATLKEANSRVRDEAAIPPASPAKAPSVHLEPGEWVYDRPKGMKAVNRPEPIPAGLIDVEEVQHHVRYEGLGMCIYSLIPACCIEDWKLSKLWGIARKAMQDIVEHLEENE